MIIWVIGKNSMKPEKEVFCNNFNKEEFTDADYAHGKRVSKDYEIKTFRGIS